jgi:hypothetical protein
MASFFKIKKSYGYAFRAKVNGTCIRMMPFLKS